MVTDKYDSTVSGPYKELRGLSTDTKPTNIANGSTFREMDTGTTYYFDEDGTAWITPQ